MLRTTWVQLLLAFGAYAGGALTQTQLDLALKHDNGCKGLLKPPCECIKMHEVRCINAQYTDTDVFLNVGVHFAFVKSITFTGNNFRQLPRSVFGPAVTHQRLELLNMSSNYLVYLDPEALTGMPHLQVLDLSGNMIELRPNDTTLLKLVPNLRRLVLRKAFNTYGNNSQRAALLEKLFKDAKLKHLKYLDLSLNELTSIPYDLGCYLPSLEHLNLRQNHLSTLSLNTDCLSHIDTIDVTANNLVQLDIDFRKTAAGLNDYSIQAHNWFQCDCNSLAYIEWLRTHELKFVDRNNLQCFRASPERFEKSKLLEVPLEELDCSVNLTGRARGRAPPDVCLVVFLWAALVSRLLLVY